MRRIVWEGALGYSSGGGGGLPEMVVLQTTAGPIRSRCRRRAEEAKKSLTMHRKAPHSVFRMRSLARLSAEWIVTNEQRSVQV